MLRGSRLSCQALLGEQSFSPRHTHTVTPNYYRRNSLVVQWKEPMAGADYFFIWLIASPELELGSLIPR